MMIRLLILVLLVIPNTWAANWYVHKGAAGTNAGTSWTNAWNEMNQINFASVACGDTIWLAGGTNYTTSPPTIAKTCTAGTVLNINRVLATDAVPVASPGWISGFDSQVVISTGGLTLGHIAYVTISGRLGVPSPTVWGIKIVAPVGGGNGVFDSDSGTIDNFVFDNVELAGPACAAAGNCTTAAYGFNVAPSTNAVTNLTVQYCNIHDDSETFRDALWTGAIVQYNLIHDMFNDGIDHEDVMYSYPNTNVTMRYNFIYNSPNDGIFYEFGGANNFKLYGNVYYASHVSFLTTKAPGTYGPLLIYNNTFQSPDGPCSSNCGFVTTSTSTMTGCVVENNVFYYVGNSMSGCTSDHNAYNYSTLNGFSWPSTEPGSFNTVTSASFVSVAGGDFHTTTGSVLRGTGTPLAAEYNTDMDGHLRGSGGLWDIGAFQFQLPATITASANSCTSGFSGCTFTATTANAPTIVRVVYTVDAYPAATFIPSSDSSFPLGPLSSVGASLTAPWALAWNTFNVMNGPHLLIATGYDALGAVVATSSAVNFTVANTTPVSCVPAISVSTGTPLGSPWNGSVNMTVNVTGGCVGDVMVYRFNIDGVNQFASSTTTSNTFTFPLDTTQFTNGPHVPSVTLRDFTHFLSFPPPPATATAFLKDAAEWSRVVTFSNGATPAQLIVNQRETRVTAGSTVSLTCSYLKADGTKSSPTCDWYSEDPSVCTVNASTGVVTVLGGVIGPCRVRVMAELISGNDLVLNGCSGDCVTSAAHPFTAPYANRVVHITTAGTGCVPGFYEGKSWFSGSNVLDLTTVAGTVGATGCQFTTGPSRTAWILVWPQNIRPYFSLTNDAILTTPVAGQTGFLNSIFTATGAFADQAYTPGYLADFCNSGYNRLETSVAYTEGQQISTNQTTAQNSQNTYVATQEGFIAGCSKLLLHGAGEVFAGTSQNLQAATRGALPGFTTPFVQYALGSWHKMPSADMSDEINSAWGFAPLQGPQIFGGANSGLTSISASAGTCTAFCAKCNLNQDKTFVISGATTAGFNSVSPATFLATGVTNTQFNFACPLVATGNYTSANNPTLRIEPFAALWIAGDYVHSDAFRQIRLWDLANPIPMLFTFANAANTNNNGVACWEGNPGSCVPAQNYGGVTSVSDYATIYLTHSDYELYLASRASTNVIIDEVAEGTGVNQLRQGYGTAYSPDLPVLAITQNSPNLYGFQGASAAVTSMVAGVMTFASDISAILPVVTSGISRLSWNGNSYYFLDYNAVTHAAHVLLAKTDFTGQGTGGTLTFSNGNTETVALACLTPSSCGQTNPCSGSTLCGDTISVSADANLGRNRGLTFRVAVTGGSAQVALNANTFVFIPESRAASTTVMYFREVPGATFNCPSSCPAATIIPDNYFVKNRNMYNSTDGSGSVIYNTGFAFSWIFETIIANVAGQRLYKGQGLSQQGYNPATGFVGNWTVNGIFDQTNVQIQQLFGTPHWENGTGTPVFHADSHASLYAQARAKYLLQPALPAPDYTEQFEAAAWGGTNGKALLVSNMTDGTQTRTLDFTSYLQSGQGFWCDYLLPDGTWTITTFAAGTTSNAFTFAPNGVVGCMFPTVFAGSLSQPTFRARLADVAGADKIVVRYAYDPYWLDTAIANVVDCGDGTSCTIPADRNVGTIWTRIQYLKSGALVANGDMQTQ